MNAAVVGILALAGVLLLVTHVKMRVRVQGGMSFRDLRALSRELDERTVEYFRVNYSGDPSGLEDALRGFLPIVRELAIAHRVPVDGDILRMLVVACVSKHRFATRGKVEAAVDAVIHSESAAA